MTRDAPEGSFADRLAEQLRGPEEPQQQPAEEPQQQPEARRFLVVTEGRQIALSFELVGDRMSLGRGDACDIVLDDDGIARRHLAFERRDNEGWFAIDQRTTGGTFKNGTRFTETLLCPNDRLNVGSSTVLLVADGPAHDAMTANLMRQRRDPLTGTMTKRVIAEEIRSAFSRARVSGCLSVALVDVDHMKRLNDVEGMTAGDAVLVDIAHTLCDAAGPGDAVGRYGGDEFAWCIRGTDAAGAIAACERARAGVAARGLATISIGVVTFVAGTHESPKQLVRDADERLLRAKREGRNRVVG